MEKLIGEGCREEHCESARGGLSAEITLREEYLGPERASSLSPPASHSLSSIPSPIPARVR